MINELPPLNRDYDRDPNIKALRRKGFLNHGSTLVGTWRLQKTSGISSASRV